MKTGGNHGQDREVLPSTPALPPVPSRAELEAAGIRIAVGIPMERTVLDAAFLYFWAIAQRGWPLLERLYGRTDVQRNQFARALLETDFTHLMMLDLDHIHPPDVIERHARWVLDDPRREVVGGLHFRRGEPFEPCAFVFGPDGELHAPADWEAGLYKVHAIGHGTLLVARRVFEVLPQPWWAYNYAYAEEGKFPSEDMWFCYQLREHGLPMWCDTTITSPHLVTNTVDEDTWRAWLVDHPAKILSTDASPAPRRSGDVQVPEMVTRVDA